MQDTTTAAAEAGPMEAAAAAGASKCPDKNCIWPVVPDINHVWCRVGVPVKPRGYIPAVSDCRDPTCKAPVVAGHPHVGCHPGRYIVQLSYTT